MSNPLSRFFFREKTMPDNAERFEKMLQLVGELEADSKENERRILTVEARIGLANPDWWRDRAGA